MHEPKPFDENNIPDVVVNIKEYKKYLDLCADDLFKTENRMYICQYDSEMTIDLATPMRYITPKIEHLPENERQKIKMLVKQMLVKRAKRTRAYNKAIGAGGMAKSSEYILAPKTGELIELFGKYHSLKEVHRIVIEKWGYEITIGSVNAFRIKFLDKIKERQEKFRSDFSEVRLAHKKPRLLELSELYNNRKEIYSRTQSKEDYKLLLATLRQLQQEVDGDKITIEGNIKVDIQHTVNLQLQREIMQKTNILDLVISRIAARARINPIYILTKLHTSLYAKHSGFGETFELADEREGINYPSMLVYDFDKIQMANGHYQKEEKNMMKFKPINIEIKAVGMDFKSKLKEKLRLRQAKINQSRDDLDKL